MSYSFTDGLKDAIKGNFSDVKDSNARYEICKSCEYYNRVVLTCGQCGCFMPAKVKLANASCPVGKW